VASRPRGQDVVLDVLAHSLCMFVASSVFFSFAFLLSTVFGDIWRPLLTACGAAIVLGYLEVVFERNLIFRTMAGRTYFETGSLPWVGLVVCAVLSAAQLYVASANVERKDF
jgi:hypothetical protein